MTREIKFRAWLKQAKGMWHISFANNKILLSHPVLSGVNNMEYKMEEVELMQYTGLKDKNGKEIYEGDILKMDDDVIEVKPPELFECDAFVVYGYEFCSNFFIDNYQKVGLDGFYSENPEVIGNVYENPELLK